MAKPKGFRKYVTEEKEGKDVHAFVVYEDTRGERFVLHHDKTKFIPVSQIKDAFNVIVGHSTSFRKMSDEQKKKIFRMIPNTIGKLDKYEDDITVLDEFQLKVGSAVHYTQSEDVE